MAVRFVAKDTEPQTPEAYAAYAYNVVEGAPFGELEKEALRKLVRAFSGFVPSGYLVTDPGKQFERHFVDEPADGAVDAEYVVAPVQDAKPPASSNVVRGKQKTRPTDQGDQGDQGEGDKGGNN